MSRKTRWVLGSSGTILSIIVIMGIVFYFFPPTHDFLTNSFILIGLFTLASFVVRLTLRILKF